MNTCDTPLAIASMTSGKLKRVAGPKRSSSSGAVVTPSSSEPDGSAIDNPDSTKDSGTRWQRRRDIETSFNRNSRNNQGTRHASPRVRPAMAVRNHKYGKTDGSIAPGKRRLRGKRNSALDRSTPVKSTECRPEPALYVDRNISYRCGSGRHEVLSWHQRREVIAVVDDDPGDGFPSGRPPRSRTGPVHDFAEAPAARSSGIRLAICARLAFARIRNQLPPSSFFKTLIDDEEADDDENVLSDFSSWRWRTAPFGPPAVCAGTTVHGIPA